MSTVYHGKTSREFDIEPSTMTSAVRQQLVSADFIPAEDTSTEAWRFYIYDTKTTNFADAILSKDLEHLVPIDGMFGRAQQLYLTNISAQTHPDLMGIGATWFFDRYMSCRVSLNDSDPTAKATNHGKFPPQMMTNVKPTSRAVAGIYDNVVVCEKGSVIAFSVNSWGAAGFGFSIKPAAGQSIVNSLYISYGEKNYNHTAGSYTYRYQDKAQQIVIDATNSMSIPSGQTVQYQRVVVKTWRVTSYRQGDTTYTCNDQPPGLSTGRVSSGRFLSARAEAGGGVTDQQLAKGVVVPGDTITPGTPHPGDNSNQTFGSISHVHEDDRDTNPLGEIVIHFFVFNSHEDAVKVIDQINAPDPKVWA